MDRYRVTCPQCGRTIEADTEDEAVDRFERHAEKEHEVYLTEQKVRDMIQAQAETAEHIGQVG